MWLCSCNSGRTGTQSYNKDIDCNKGDNRRNYGTRLRLRLSSLDNADAGKGNCVMVKCVGKDAVSQQEVQLLQGFRRLGDGDKEQIVKMVHTMGEARGTQQVRQRGQEGSECGEGLGEVGLASDLHR